MFDIGFFELLVFGAVALIVLGPEKLPHAARTAGKWYAKIRRTVSAMQAEIEHELNLAEAQQKMREELEKIRQTEQEMQRQMNELKSSLKHFQSDSSPNPHKMDTEDQTDASEDRTQLALGTKPLENYWFKLSDYDKKRRLLPAPFLPNYKADDLLVPTPNASQPSPLKQDALHSVSKDG